MKGKSIILILLIVLIKEMNAQFIVPINVNKGISQNDIQVIHTPFDIGTIKNVFDNVASSLVRTPSINPVVITLCFSRIQSVCASKIIMTAGNNNWTLEVADTVPDLTSQTGSYLKLFDSRLLTDGVPDSVSFPQLIKKVFRITAYRTTGDNYVHLNEWQLYTNVTVNNISISPNQPKLIRNSSYQLCPFVLDASGNMYQIPPRNFLWSSNDTSIIYVSNTGVISSRNATGTSLIIVNYDTIKHSTTAAVLDDFTLPPAQARTVKVALVIQNPSVPSQGNQTIRELMNWNDPYLLANTLKDSLNAASHGTVNYEITQIYDDTMLFTHLTDLSGIRLSRDSMASLLLEPGWATLQAQNTKFDYNAMLNYYNFCAKSDSGIIDEVWLYGFPYAGCYESILTGDDAFWYNSPPLTGNTCSDQLPIMAYNYERGLDCALESYAHRYESAMKYVYGRWSYTSTDPNNWELFTYYNKVKPGNAHNGNAHYPPNGTSDYDYANHNAVISYTDNWLRYPFLYHNTRTFDCNEWECDHAKYLLWWYQKMPHHICVSEEGILNNWWRYVIDYKEAASLSLTMNSFQCYPCNTFSVTLESRDTLISGTHYYILSAPKGYQYRWSNQDVTYSTLVQNTSGVYVTLTDDDGCSQTVSSDLGIKETLPDDAVELFPNPASQDVLIKGIKKNSQISIFDLNNKLHIKCDLYINDSVIDISKLDAGVYIMFIESQGTISIKKLIKL